MNCQYCQGKCKKNGKRRNGAQKLYCEICKKHQQTCYKSQAYKAGIDGWIVNLVRESVGVRGISRLLNIAMGTVLKRIVFIAAKIGRPEITPDQNNFEVDELWTYIGRKRNEFWMAYAYNKAKGRVEDFVIGKRTKQTLRKLITSLMASGVKQIRTDKLPHYKKLVPKEQHKAGAHFINHIERNNLSIRTHLKRLSRKTICFSRSEIMLESCLRIYFWHDSLSRIEGRPTK